MNYRESIINTLSYDIDNCCGDIETMLTQPNPNLTSLSQSLLDYFVPYVIEQQNDDVIDKVQKTIALRHCLNNPKSNQKIENFLIEKITDGNIHFNKILGNINQF